MSEGARLTLGPLLFNWPAEKIAEFYRAIAEDAPVDTVYLGDIVCPKRFPFLTEVLPEAAERLVAAGKEVVWSTLALIADEKDVTATRELTEFAEGPVEANDVTALSMLAGRPHVIGPLVNVYNEGTLRWLAGRGATRVCLSPELPREALAALGRAAAGVELEIQVYGRMPLALSARCYHARAHRLHKDGCQFVCDRDPDGMDVETLDGESFLAVNGIQTLSHAVLDLSAEAAELRAVGIRHFRLSPQAVDMVAIARAWRDLLDGNSNPGTAGRIIEAETAFASLSNGYFHGRPGADRTHPVS